MLVYHLSSKINIDHRHTKKKKQWMYKIKKVVILQSNRIQLIWLNLHLIDKCVERSLESPQSNLKRYDSAGLNLHPWVWTRIFAQLRFPYSQIKIRNNVCQNNVLWGLKGGPPTPEYSSFCAIKMWWPMSNTTPKYNNLNILLCGSYTLLYRFIFST